MCRTKIINKIINKGQIAHGFVFGWQDGATEFARFYDALNDGMECLRGAMNLPDVLIPVTEDQFNQAMSVAMMPHSGKLSMMELFPLILLAIEESGSGTDSLPMTQQQIIALEAAGIRLLSKLPASHQPVNLKLLNRAPFFQNGLQAKSGFEMCFVF